MMTFRSPIRQLFYEASLEQWPPMAHKKPMKIEIFYFFANAWMNRALKAQQDHAKLDRWWGDSTWRPLIDLPAFDRAMC